jgi:hypothetical protein
MTGETLPPGNQQESLYRFVTRVARSASDRQLWAALAGAVVVVVAIVLTGLERWPVAAIAGTCMTIALWALIEHHPGGAHPRAVSLLEQLLVVAGSLLAVLAAYGALFWVLGPRWNL